MLPPQLYWLILLAIVVYAFRRGAMDERIAAMTCLGGTLATMLVNGSQIVMYDNIETGVLIVDFVAFGIFVGIALKSARFWPLWVAGFQLSSTLAHFLRVFDADMIPHVYAAAERFWIYPIFLAIVVGIWRANRHTGAHPQRLPR